MDVGDFFFFYNFPLILCSHQYEMFFFTIRRQELRELRLLQKEEQRAQQQLSNKLLQQREQIYRRFEQEMTVSLWILVPLNH